MIVWISSPLGILAWFPCLDAEEGTFPGASRLSRLAVAQEAGVQAAQPVNVKEVVYSYPGFRPSPGGPPGIAVARAFDYLTEVHGNSASRANFAQYGGGSLESREYALRVRRGNLAAGQLADGPRRMAQDGSACGRGNAVRCERGGMDWGVRRHRMGQAGEKRRNSEDKGRR